MYNEPHVLMTQLVKSVKSSQEYNQYQSLLENIKARPEVYQRVAEFRKRSIALQMSPGGQSIDANNELQKEFADLQINGLANEFMAAEHRYCQMIRKLQEQFLDGIDLEVEFLDM